MRQSYIALLLKNWFFMLLKSREETPPPPKKTHRSPHHPHEFFEIISATPPLWSLTLLTPFGWIHQSTKDSFHCLLRCFLRDQRRVESALCRLVPKAAEQASGQCLWGNFQGENRNKQKLMAENPIFFFQLKMQHFPFVSGICTYPIARINKDGKKPFYKIPS